MAIRKIRNTWWVDFRFDRKRYRKRSPDNSRAGAQKYEILLRQKLANGETLGRDDEKEKEQNQIFKEFAWKWFDIYVKSNNKYSEIRGKKYILESHLVPFFGKTPINQISNLQVERYKEKKIGEGLSNKTINNHLTVLGKCLRTAQEWIDIKEIPRIKKMKVPSQGYDFLSIEESELLLNNGKGVWYEMILVALKTGVRLGELIGLCWSDIDWENRILTVRRSRYRNITVVPKGNRERHIPLLNEICETFGSRQQKDGFVFVDEKGEPFKGERCRCTLQRICSAVGLRKIGWHALRHTFASHLVGAGASIKAVQELLGHTDIHTTMRYAHLESKALESTINLLSSRKIKNFGQQAVNTYTNLTKIGELSDYDKDIFLANVKQNRSRNSCL